MLSERVKLSRRREDAAKHAAISRIQKRNDARMEMLRLRGCRSKARLDRAVPRMKLKPKEAAYEHYVEVYGPPSHTKCATLSAHVTAKEIVEKAREVGINEAKQPYLLWVIQAQLSAGLPPGWKESAAGYEFREKSKIFQTQVHPGDVYFAAVLWNECERVKRLKPQARSHLEQFRWLEFIEAGKTHYYDFVSGERTFDSAKPECLIHQSAPFILSSPTGERTKESGSEERVTHDEAVEIHRKIMCDGLQLEELEPSTTTRRHGRTLDDAVNGFSRMVDDEENEEEDYLEEERKLLCRRNDSRFAIVKIRDEHVKQLLTSLDNDP